MVAGYSLVGVATASPFGRLPARAVDGVGLQPVLEHPAMAWHPPLLALGLVGLLVPTLAASGRLGSGVPAGTSVPAGTAGSGVPDGSGRDPGALPGLALALPRRRAIR